MDDAFVRAAEELFVERGFAFVTVDALVARAGTTKPAFYRRYANLSEIVPVVMERLFGEGFDVDTGGFAEDVRLIQEWQSVMFRDVRLARLVPGFLDVAQRDAEQSRAFETRFLGPRRAVMLRAVERAIVRGEVSEDTDAEWICDLATGPFLMRALVPGLDTIDEVFIARTVIAVMGAVTPCCRVG